MKIKKYEVNDMKEALKLIKQDLGPDAVILTTRKIMKPSGLGLFPRPVLEVTAAVNYDKNAIARAKSQKTEQKIPEPVTPVAYKEPQNDLFSDDDDEYLRSLLAGTKDADVNLSGGFSQAEETYTPPRPKQKEDTGMQLAEIITTLGLDKISSLASDIDDIKKQLSQMSNTLNSPTNINIDLGSSLKDFYSLLIKNGMEELLAYRLLKNVEKKLPETPGKALIRGIITQDLADTISVESDYVSALNKKVVAFIGPTGVGKTTTIAKIAAQLVLRYSQKVCLITADTFRIGAVDQLQTYADIVNIPLYVASGPQEFKKLIDELHNNYEYILLDTTGRSPYDNSRLDDLTAFLNASPLVASVLVLSLAANHVELGEMYEKYAEVEPTYLVFSKLDETRYFGPLANIPIRKKVPLLLLSTGQDVPDDLETPDGKKIAKKLLQEIPALWKEN